MLDRLARLGVGAPIGRRRTFAAGCALLHSFGSGRRLRPSGGKGRRPGRLATPSTRGLWHRAGMVRSPRIMLGECFADNGARKPSYEQKQRHHQREQHPPSGCHMPSAALLGYLHFDLPSRRGTGGSPDRAHTV